MKWLVSASLITLAITKTASAEVSPYQGTFAVEYEGGSIAQRTYEEASSDCKKHGYSLPTLEILQDLGTASVKVFENKGCIWVRDKSEYADYNAKGWSFDGYEGGKPGVIYGSRKGSHCQVLCSKMKYDLGSAKLLRYLHTFVKSEAISLSLEKGEGRDTYVEALSAWTNRKSALRVFIEIYNVTEIKAYKDAANKIIKEDQDSDDAAAWAVNPANPVSPLSPLNPANPASPLYPRN